MVVIGLFRWTGVANGAVVGLPLAESRLRHQRDALGYSNRRIIFQHILPNARARLGGGDLRCGRSYFREFPVLPGASATSACRHGVKH